MVLWHHPNVIVVGISEALKKKLASDTCVVFCVKAKIPNGDFSFYKTLVSNLTPSFSPSKMAWNPMIYHSMPFGKQSNRSNVYNTIHRKQCITYSLRKHAVHIYHQSFMETYDKNKNYRWQYGTWQYIFKSRSLWEVEILSCIILTVIWSIFNWIFFMIHASIFGSIFWVFSIG